jgi:hypothetical protein
LPTSEKAQRRVGHSVGFARGDLGILQEDLRGGWNGRRGYRKVLQIPLEDEPLRDRFERIS